MEVLKFRVKSVTDLIKLNFRALAADAVYLNYMNGKVFTITGVGEILMVFYTETEKKGEYIEYDTVNDEWRWIDKKGSPSALTKYIPIVNVEDSNIDLFD